jgi:DNA (cytosine-5)-methyltransferase 1
MATAHISRPGSSPVNQRAGFNTHGIAEAPRFSNTHAATTGHWEARLQAHPVGKEWVAGYGFEIRTGECQGETLPPSLHDQRFATIGDAVPNAAARLLASLDAKYPAAPGTKTEAKALTALRAWVEEQARRASAGEFDKAMVLDGLRFIDLFAGIGGFRLPLESMGAKCVLSCEIDKNARRTYAANFDTSGHPFPEDITQVRADDVPDHDILTAGFPCQPFSAAGKRQGADDPRGRLFHEIVRIVAAKLPRLVLLENVPAFLTLDGGKHANQVHRLLGNLGYAVTRKVMSAVEFGLPQLRERVFFVATRRDVAANDSSFAFPVGAGASLCVADILDAKAPKGSIDPKRIVADPTRDPDSLTQRIGRLDGSDRQNARVMDPKGVGMTLLAGQPNCGLYMVDGRPRALTARERARMQGFPESFHLPASYTQACRQFGNSVAVPVVAALAEAAANHCFHQAA